MPRAYSGTIAGHTFDEGRLVSPQLEDARRVPAPVVGYIARHGLEFDDDGLLVIADQEGPEPVDARDASTPQVVGTRLRDAAVDPEPVDFLPPVNAGKADPHGPLVVSPQIHDDPQARAIVTGPVEEPPAQEQAETSAAAELAADVVQPATGDRKAEWIDYAVAQGADREDAEAATKAELIELYGGETEEEEG